MEIYVHVEISKNSRVKYEYDKDLNMLICDRVLPLPFTFPFNYGFIPNTISGDGDPIDVIIYMEEPLVPNSIIKCRIIGALETEDEKGEDIKLIVVPAKKVSYDESTIDDIIDIPSHFIKKIIYFYKHYKDLESEKFVKIGNLINQSNAIEIYNKSKK
jgi:inorganic pyrophosphatase